MSYAQSQTGGMNQEGRPDSDFYETPDVAVESLLRVEAFEDTIWEPACGAGAISRVLEANYYAVASSDLYDHGFGETGLDFFDDAVQHRFVKLGCRSIVTNPPFSDALDFAEAGVSWIRRENVHGRMALLCRLAWLESQKRRPFFDATPPSRVWVFSKRLPMMHRPGWNGNRSTSTIAFAWYVWDAKVPKHTELHWL